MSSLGEVFLTSLGTPVTLGKEIGRGGEGAVFELSGSGNRAVKIYLDGKAAQRRDKILTVISAGFYDRSSYVAFPADTVFDRRGNFSGFVMRRVENASPVHQLWDRRDRQERFPKSDVRFIVRVAANLARAVAELHSYGCVVGDMNESAFLVTGSAEVALIDSDSYQYSVGLNVFKCVVGTPQYVPPEQQGKDQRTLGQRIPDHDCFGLAVIIFRLLMFGAHPYMGVWKRAGESPAAHQNIAGFRYAYGQNHERMDIGPQPTAPPVEWLSGEILEAFDRAFGKHGPKGRPQAHEWIGMLERLEAGLVRCRRSSYHFHRPGTPCPICVADRVRKEPIFPYRPTDSENKPEEGGSYEPTNPYPTRKTISGGLWFILLLLFLFALSPFIIRFIKVVFVDTTTIPDTAPPRGVVPAPPEPESEWPQLAIWERADFVRARQALEREEFPVAADLFQRFTEMYTDSPFAVEAHFLRGEAYARAGETSLAARAYLESFSEDPVGARAADALFRLGESLAVLGQTEEACVMLGQVGARFPNSQHVAAADAEFLRLGCE